MARFLLIATTNPGKVREVAVCLAGIPGLEVISLADLPPRPEVPETGHTFAENAAAKAVGYGRAHEGLTLADDSGLCVDALGGEPGVRSARYGGPGLDDPGRCRYLLGKIRDVPEVRRTARFECALALARPGAMIATFTGRVEGRLLFEPRGANGFGYDPVFFYEPAGRSFAEMTREEKSAVSHRGRALQALRRYLEEHQELIDPAKEATP